MIAALTIVTTLLFGMNNAQFFVKSDEQIKNGANWEYIGPTPIDRNAEQLFEFPDLEGEKYIMFKLVKQK